jgi:tetratricopeptide (TPR) repeat protein
VFSVPTLAVPDEEAGLEATQASAAVRLFLERAREARPNLRVDAEVIRTIARICADLDGLPLGIELAAAHARALAPQEIANRIRDRFRFLVSWRQLSPARHRTLREAMDWSYALLAPREQRMLRWLSVFAGGCTLEAASTVCLHGDEDGALGSLERLVEASLVSVDMSAMPTRYGLLETVRQYGAEALDEAGETAEARARHVAYFATWARAVATPLRTNVAGGQLPRIMSERDNVRAALVWARDSGNWPDLVTIAEGLWWLWWIRGELSEVRRWLELAVEHPEGSDPTVHANATLGLAGIAWAQADDEASLKWANAARTRFAELGNRRGEGSALNTTALTLHRQQDLEGARAAYERALELYRSVAVDPQIVARSIDVTRDNLASAMHELHDHDGAQALYLEAREGTLARGDAEGVAMNDLHLAIIDAEVGRWADARPRLASALETYRELGFLQYAAECLEGASAVANAAGSAEEAAFMLGAAQRLREQIGLPPVPFMATLRAAQIDIATGSLGREAMEAAVAVGRAAPPDAAMARTIDFLRG